MEDIGELVAFLEARQLKLSTAESCTCGLMASLLANEPGCGQVLDCGFIVYSPQSKHRLLGVDFATIERFGLTSEEVASEMAIGALEASRADLAVANTGVADESEEDPGGTQCYAYALRQGERLAVVSETVKFDGDRVEIRKRAAHHGLARIPEKLEALTKKLD
ncbi:CinA family protein [Azotobacter vinelandii]|uniref:CinA family protein n=1 Tax=Azotobacter vinelandii TaxID=354 RepID=UPI0007747434|nr:CinA family protein [Azotobacter vinelandii]